MYTTNKTICQKTPKVIIPCSVQSMIIHSFLCIIIYATFLDFKWLKVQIIHSTSKHIWHFYCSHSTTEYKSHFNFLYTLTIYIKRQLTTSQDSLITETKAKTIKKREKNMKYPWDIMVRSEYCTIFTSFNVTAYKMNIDNAEWTLMRAVQCYIYN